MGTTGYGNEPTRDEDVRFPGEQTDKDTMHSPSSWDSLTPDFARLLEEGAETPGPPPGAFVGYTIVKEIHRGGQGVVYEAIQQSTNRRVAIKVMLEGPFAGPADKARFEREIQVLGQLHHPNIVTIHDTGVAAGCLFIVMDYISGQPLDAYVEARRAAAAKSRKGTSTVIGTAPSAAEPVGGAQASGLSVHETLGLFAKISDALNAAHALGIVHRDLKPGNIRIDEKGEPHLLDFGLAKMPASDSDAAVMTKTGQFLGSLPWAAPEQAEGKPSRIDPRTDVYSLGVILYQVLTGRFPYEVVGNMRDILDNILQAEPHRPSALRKGLDRDVETIVLTCLRKERERRYADAGAAARDIRHYLAGEPIEARRESVAYLLQNRAKNVTRRQPIVIGLVTVVAAVFFAHAVGVRLLFDWTSLAQVFERYAYRGIPVSGETPKFERVAILALTANTDLAQAALAADVPSDCLANDPKCLRRIHGALMKRLAAARPGVVAWAVNFPGESAHDEAFLEGVTALRDVGVDVSVGTAIWTLTPEGLPNLSRNIAAATHWGCSASQLSSDTWRIPLAVQRGMTATLPSFAASTWAAYRQPGSEADWQLDRPTTSLGAHYWRPDPQSPRLKLPTGVTERLAVSTVTNATEDAPEFGILKGDCLGHYMLSLPSDAACAAATLDYDMAFTADPAWLRQRLGGKIVIITDQRRPIVAATPDGRHLWGVYAHAAALDMLLRQTRLVLARSWQFWGLSVVAAIGGLALGCALGGRRFVRWSLLVVLLAVFILAGLLWAWYGHTLCNTLIAGIAFVAACELMAPVSQVCRRQKA